MLLLLLAFSSSAAAAAKEIQWRFGGFYWHPEHKSVYYRLPCSKPCSHEQSLPRRASSSLSFPHNSSSSSSSILLLSLRLHLLLITSSCALFASEQSAVGCESATPAAELRTPSSGGGR